MKIEEYRAGRQLTQDEVARAAGISRSAYANIENGRRRPSVEVARKLAKVLGNSWTEFYEEDADDDACGNQK